MAEKAKYLFIASMDVDADKEALFNEVYDKEHIPALLKVPGVLKVYRGVREPLTMFLGGEKKTIVAEGEPKYSAYYELASAEVLTSEAWGKAVRRTVVMLVQGLPIAFLLFVLFPRLTGPLWGLPKDTAARTGLSERMSPGAISDLSLSDAVVFRVDFQGAVPAPRDRYWRGPVLTRFDGREWSHVPRPGGGQLVRPTASRVSYQVTLEPHGKPWLFALELPASLPQLIGDDRAQESYAFLTRDQQLIARQSVSQVVRYQQLSVLRQLVDDLNMPLKLIASPTVREKDGLALSSRNAYLSDKERAIAPALYAVISEAAAKVAAGTPFTVVTTDATESLAGAGFTKVDYVEIRDAATLSAAVSPGKPLRILAAAWLGKTRLIDNVAAGSPS